MRAIILAIMICCGTQLFGQSTFYVEYPGAGPYSGIYHTTRDQFIGLRSGCVAVYDNLGVMINRWCPPTNVYLRDLKLVNDSTLVLLAYSYTDSAILCQSMNLDFEVNWASRIERQVGQSFGLRISDVNAESAVVVFRRGQSSELFKFDEFGGLNWQVQFEEASIAVAYNLNKAMTLVIGGIYWSDTMPFPQDYNGYYALLDSNGQMVNSTVTFLPVKRLDAIQVNDSIVELYSDHVAELNLNTFSLKTLPTSFGDKVDIGGEFYYIELLPGDRIYVGKIDGDTLTGVYYQSNLSLIYWSGIMSLSLLSDSALLFNGYTDTDNSTYFHAKVSLSDSIHCMAGTPDVYIRGFQPTLHLSEYAMWDPVALNYSILGSAGVELSQTAPEPTLSNCSFTAIDENDVANLKIQLYPNPVSDRLYLEGDFGRFERVEILNAAGQYFEAKLSEMGSTQLAIDVRDLPTGLYIVRIMSDAGSIVERFVVE